jgi:cellulose biosynthesis protein BcsQ
MGTKTRFIAIGNQKGGVGKSALTVIYASYLHYELLKNVIVVDCGYPQHSIMNMRESDIETVNATVCFSPINETIPFCHRRRCVSIHCFA